MNMSEFRKRAGVLSTLPRSWGKEPQHTWRRNRACMRKNLTRNPLVFMTWSTVVSTMFNGCNSFTEVEAERLGRLSFGPPNLLEPTGFGNDEAELYNLAHQAYHVHELTSHTDIHVRDLSTIVEFGGGYGAMALVCHRLGFRGDYIMCDFPEMELLQEYYLSNVRVPVRFGDLPSSADLLIACWSLSEAPLNCRDRFMNIANSHLIAYQPKWFEIDNERYFSEYAKRRVSVKWFDLPATLLPNRYLMGRQCTSR